MIKLSTSDRRQLENVLRLEISNQNDLAIILPSLYAAMAIGKESKAEKIILDHGNEFGMSDYHGLSEMAIDFWIAKQALITGLKTTQTIDLEAIILKGNERAIEAVSSIHSFNELSRTLLLKRIDDMQYLRGQDPYHIAQDFTARLFGEEYHKNGLLIMHVMTEFMPNLIALTEMMAKIDSMIDPKKAGVFSKLIAATKWFLTTR